MGHKRMILEYRGQNPEESIENINFEYVDNNLYEKWT